MTSLEARVMLPLLGLPVHLRPCQVARRSAVMLHVSNVAQTGLPHTGHHPQLRTRKKLPILRKHDITSDKASPFLDRLSTLSTLAYRYGIEVE